MLEEDKIRSCFEQKEAICRTEIHETQENDPRSFCHSICAKPIHICGETTCEKLISVESHGAKKFVCIPRQKCKVKRHFGPIEEEFIDSRRAKGTNLGAPKPKVKLEGKQTKRKSEKEKSDENDDVYDKSGGIKVTRRPEGRKLEDKVKEEYTKDSSAEIEDTNDKDNTNIIEQKEQENEEIQKLLGSLSEKIDSQGMAAIYALAGSDICPCCECKICKCKLRNVDSQTLLDMRKQALIKKQIREEELLKWEEELGKREDLSEDEKRKILQEKIKKENEFGYSFDYFYQPNLEAFENERRLKQEKERQAEIEKEKIAAQKEEEERKKKEEEALSKIESLEEEIQAEPETAEQGSQFLGSEAEIELSDEFSELQESKKGEEDKTKEVPEWQEYKVTEWAGVRHQDVPTVIETATAEAVAKASVDQPALFDSVSERVSESSQISKKATPEPSPSTQQSVQPQLDLQQLHTFDESWLDDNEKLSMSRTPTSKLSDVQASTSTIKKKPIPDAQPEIPSTSIQQKKPPTAAETMLSIDSFMSTDSKVSAPSTAITEEGTKAASKEVSEDYSYSSTTRKMTFLTDVCQCLPGYCTCAERHYIFKEESKTEDFGMGFKQILLDKMISTKDKTERGGETFEQNGSEFSENSSCSCIHTEDEIQVTPVTSRVEVVAVPPVTPNFQPEIKKMKSFVSCIIPKYQKTLVIVKPQAVQFKDVILRAIKREGLDILEERIVHLTPEQVAEIYTENFGSAYFPLFVKQMSSSPILVIAIAGTNAIQRWNTVVGPEKNIPVSWFYPASMRRRFGIHKDILDVMKLSDDFQRAKTEIRYFFPLNIIDPIVISSTMVQDYCDKFIHPTLLKGLHKLVIQKPSDPIGFLADWLLINNPFQPFYKQIQKLPRIYEYQETEGSIYHQESTHSEEFDPRSYCYNVISKVERVCRKSVYRKFLQARDQITERETICSGIPTCRLKRHFGPETATKSKEDDGKVSTVGSQLEKVSETDIPRGRLDSEEPTGRDETAIIDISEKSFEITEKVVETDEKITKSIADEEEFEERRDENEKVIGRDGESDVHRNGEISVHENGEIDIHKHGEIVIHAEIEEEIGMNKNVISEEKIIEYIIEDIVDEETTVSIREKKSYEPVIDDEKLEKSIPEDENVIAKKGKSGESIINYEEFEEKPDKNGKVIDEKKKAPKHVIIKKKPTKEKDKNGKVKAKRKKKSQVITENELLEKEIEQDEEVTDRKMSDDLVMDNKEFYEEMDENGKELDKKSRDLKLVIDSKKPQNKIDADVNGKQKDREQRIVDGIKSIEEEVDDKKKAPEWKKKGDETEIGEEKKQVIIAKDQENKGLLEDMSIYLDGKEKEMVIGGSKTLITPVEDDVPDFGEMITSKVPKSVASTRRTSTDSAVLARRIPVYIEDPTTEDERSTRRSSIERWVECREPFLEDGPTTLTGASAEPLDEEYPAAEIHGPIRIITKGKEKPCTPKSNIPTKMKIVSRKGRVKKQLEEIDMDIYTPVLKRMYSEPHLMKFERISAEHEPEVPEISPVKIPFPTIEPQPPQDVQLTGDTKIDVLTFDEAAKARAQSRKQGFKYFDVCHCLPGFCVCGSQHFIFKRADIESEPSPEENRIQAELEAVDYELMSGEDISTQSSCTCYHSWEDDDEFIKVTPTPRFHEEVVQVPKKPKKRVVCTQPTFQKTVIIVKPEAMHFKDVILRAITKAGLDIINERFIQLTPEQVAEVYSENCGSAYFPMFVQKISSTPILVLMVAGNYAVARWKYIIGQGDVMPSSWFYPESMKRRFGVHCDIFGAIGTSTDFPTAKNELRYFFPLDIIEPIVIESAEIQDYCDKFIHSTLLKALCKITNEKPKDPLLYLAEWLLKNNPYQPYYLDSLVALAPT